MSKRVIHGWMNPKNYTKPIVARRNEATSVTVIIPGENVEPVDGIPVVVIPTHDYDRLVASEYQCCEKERAIARWDDASARLYRSLAAKDAEIAALGERCERLRDLAADASGGMLYIEGAHGRLYGVGWDRVRDKRILCEQHKDLDAPPAAASEASKETNDGT